MKTISTVGLQAAAASRLKFTPDHARLYDLIFRRAVASQMAPARYNATTLLFNVAGEKFKAVGRVLKFDGILKVYTTADEDKGWGTPPPRCAA